LSSLENLILENFYFQEIMEIVAATRFANNQLEYCTVPNILNIEGIRNLLLEYLVERLTPIFKEAIDYIKGEPEVENDTYKILVGTIYDLNTDFIPTAQYDFEDALKYALIDDTTDQ
jgi:hypothetical protein